LAIVIAINHCFNCPDTYVRENADDCHDYGHVALLRQRHMVLLFMRIFILIMLSAKSGVNDSKRRLNNGSGGICCNTYNSARYLKWHFNNGNCRVYRNPDHCSRSVHRQKRQPLLALANFQMSCS
jgi:hypothetical protein